VNGRPAHSLARRYRESRNEDIGKKMGIFRHNAVDLIVRHFPENRAAFGAYRSDDQIASLFFSVAFDLIARTAYTLRKATPEGKVELADSVSEFFPVEDVNVQTLLRTFMDEENPEETILENYIFLDMLREKYLSLVRGEKPECWGNIEESISGKRARCPSHDDCHEETGPEKEEGAILRCETYQVAWRKTDLAVECDGPLSDSARELLLLIYEICPALRLITDPLEMEAFLAREVLEIPDGGSDRRSARGVIVRILTDFVEFSLEDLNHRLQMPREKKYRFLS